MKRKYIILLLSLGIICILLPFAIDFLFDIGEKHPIIITRFSASDILSYCSGVIGIFLSIVAIIMSLQTNDIDIKIKHAHTINDNNQESIWLEIVNNSVFECQITSVEFEKGSVCASIGKGAFGSTNTLTTVYFGNDAEAWSSIFIDENNSYLTNATRYFYSEVAPDAEGNYWHYDENGNVAVW